MNAKTNTAGQNIIKAIGLLIKGGVDVQTAVERICGAGSYERLIGMIYDDLRASQGL